MINHYVMATCKIFDFNKASQKNGITPIMANEHSSSFQHTKQGKQSQKVNKVVYSLLNTFKSTRSLKLTAS